MAVMAYDCRQLEGPAPQNSLSGPSSLGSPTQMELRWGEGPGQGALPWAIVLLSSSRLRKDSEAT